MSLRLRVGLVLLWCLMAAAPVYADWYATPFIGVTFGAVSDFVALSNETGKKKLTFGGSVMQLGSGVLGIEGDFSRTNGFFEPGLIPALKSNVTTLMGNVVIAVPLRVTGYGLRPYASGGPGLMRASQSEPVEVVTFHRNLFALNLGGGFIGLVSDKRGVRFDLRYFRNIRTVGEGSLTENRPTLGFWRGSVGVIFKF